ncbi:hypothetical protein SMD22_00345 (plasmid) [Brevibacillus halotolerans]|nr:hypothetical protein SMD22_00345 [Brevibacillus halotolerans]
MDMKKLIEVDVPEQPKKSHLQRKVERLIKKAEKQRYEFNNIDLAMFASLESKNWNEESVNFLALQHFERLYDRASTRCTVNPFKRVVISMYGQGTPCQTKRHCYLRLSLAAEETFQYEVGERWLHPS